MPRLPRRLPLLSHSARGLVGPRIACAIGLTLGLVSDAGCTQQPKTAAQKGSDPEPGDPASVDAVEPKSSNHDA
ncbi:MAG: hypothetical protein ACPG77_20785, partial [Nannocystaceae bacterium]